MTEIFASPMADSIDQTFSEYQQAIDLRVAAIPSPFVAQKHRDRLRKRYERNLLRIMRSAHQYNDLVWAQTLRSRVVERDLLHLSFTTDDTIKERELINAINALREQKRLQPLTYSTSLKMVAYRHALDLFKNFPYDTNADGILEVISHTGSDGSRVIQRAKGIVSFEFLAENIAYNHKTALQVIEDWKSSPGHYATLISPQAKHI